MILVDFWTYSCVNCLRTLPFLKKWHQEYAKEGLVIVGVHSPEFDFEKEPENVGAFIERAGIEYPVVMDNDYAIWNAYANHVWPHHYFIDRDGYIRHEHAGEGEYKTSEQIILSLLREMNPDLVRERVSEIAEMSESGSVCYPQSSELYLGVLRGSPGNPVTLAGDRPVEYVDDGSREEGHYYLDGLWTETAEYAQHARVTSLPHDHLAVRYKGVEVNAVMGPAAHDVAFKVFLTLDGRPVPENARGEDVSEDAMGTFVIVDLPRMYRLVEENGYAERDLVLSTASDQLRVYAFTFGGCSHPPAIRDEQRRVA